MIIPNCIKYHNFMIFNDESLKDWKWNQFKNSIHNYLNKELISRATIQYIFNLQNAAFIDGNDNIFILSLKEKNI